MHDSNEISTATPCFRGQATRRDYWKYSPMFGHVGNQRWRPSTGVRKDIRRQGFRRQFYFRLTGNGLASILMLIPFEQHHYFYCVFYGTENVLLPLILWCYHVYSWYTCNYIISTAILDFWLQVLSGNSTIERFDSENVGVAVEVCS